MSELDFADLLWEKIDYEDQERYDEYVPSENDWQTYAVLDLLGLDPDIRMLQSSGEETGADFAG